PNSPSFSSGKVQNMEFEYKPGFKTGLALSFKKDSWNLYIEYARYHATNTVSHTNTNPADNNFYLNWFSASNQAAAPNTATRTNSSWNLRYDMIDVNLGRPFYNGKNLTINPIFGGRGGWIQQQFSMTAYFPVSNTNPRSLAKSQSWILGPRAGFASNWLLGKGFRFFGDAYGSLFYQNFHFVKVRQQSYANPSSLFANEKNRRGYVTFNVDAIAGFGYGTYLDHYKWNFDLSAGYEIEYYFNQNMMRNLNDLINFAGGSSDSSAGDLMMHGLTIKGILNF
ncbi:MAG: hypothetical protein HZB76_03440, partial [Chlamydiae bacterium]|nr:hypothetical protein [Chlamydiota bacterium]